MAVRVSALVWSSVIVGACVATACGGDDGTRPFQGSPTPSRPPIDDETTSSSGRTGSSGRGGSSGRSGSSSSGESSSSGTPSSSSGGEACDDADDAPNSQASVSYRAVTAGAGAFDVPGRFPDDQDDDWYGYDITGSATTVLYLREKFPSTLCVYMQCKAGTLTLDCLSGSVDAVAPNGAPGCCATGTDDTAALLTTYMYCASAPDDSLATISVSPSADACLDYTLNVKF